MSDASRNDPAPTAQPPGVSAFAPPLATSSQAGGPSRDASCGPEISPIGGHFEKALAIAKQEKMEDESAASQLLLADMYISIPDYEKALNYVTDASARLSSSKSDSLKVEASITKGKVSEATNRKDDALGNYLKALAAAEAIRDSDKNKRRKAELKRNSYLRLSGFYSRIGELDKAIDYYTVAYKELDHIGDKRVPYQRCIDINVLGNLFAAKKNYNMAISYYERSIAMAASLSFTPTLKVPGYISLVNQYLQMKEPVKAMAYMNSPRGQALVSFLNQFGMTASVYQAYAAIYSEMNQFDSARIYFATAIQTIPRNSNFKRERFHVFGAERLFDCVAQPG